MTQQRDDHAHRSAAPSPGRVGDYRLVTVIGEGGMGVVHLAEHTSGRRVALKVLRPHVVGDHEARQRLAREVGSLERVRSPRVAEILDADPHGPIPFVVTRYVPGLSLHEHVRENGPVEGEDLLVLAEGLADAVLAVHRVGVLHRDIKPGNVLMEGRAPVLIDFGLARLAEDVRITQTGWLLGTPGYLAPEILYGDEPTPASDVHALAATVAFAATGSPPYGRGHAMGVADRVRRGEHDLRGVPEELLALLAQCLSPDPLERPALVDLHADLRSRLDAVRAPRPSRDATPAQPEWTMPLAVARARDHPRAEATTDRYDPTGRAPGSADPVGPTTGPATGPAPGTVRMPTARGPAFPAPQPVVQPVVQPASVGDSAAPWRPRRTPVEQPPAPLWPAEPVAAADERVGGPQLLVTLALGLTVAAALALAPYAAGAVVVVIVVALRFASVTGERHSRRQELRGRRRWYDVPASALASPGYLVISLVGSVVLTLWSVAVGVAVVLLALLAGASVPGALLSAGMALVVATWWGPGSERVRVAARGGLAGLSSPPALGWGVVALGLVVALTLVAALTSSGPVWTPSPSAPWSPGFLAELRELLQPR